MAPGFYDAAAQHGRDAVPDRAGAGICSPTPAEPSPPINLPASTDGGASGRPAQRNRLPLAIAQAMIEGFNKHYRIFRRPPARQGELEAADWQGQLSAVRDRVQFTTTG